MPQYLSCWVCAAKANFARGERRARQIWMLFNVSQSLRHLQESLPEENLFDQSRKNTTKLPTTSCMDRSFALHGFEVVQLVRWGVRLVKEKHQQVLPRQRTRCTSWRELAIWLQTVGLPRRLSGASVAVDPDRVDNDHHHLSLARHPVLQMALLGRLHLVRRITVRAQSCPCSLLVCLVLVVWDSSHLDWVLCVLHRTWNIDHLSSMHSFVHDAAARLSDLHESGDRN